MFVQNHQVGFLGKPLMFFYFFWSGIHGLLFEFCVVFTNMVADKYETLVVFMEGKKKINETPWCPGWALFGRRGNFVEAASSRRLRPPRRNPPSGRKGPILSTRGFQFILFLPSVKPPKFQFFSHHFRETTKNSNK